MSVARGWRTRNGDVGGNREFGRGRMVCCGSTHDKSAPGLVAAAAATVTKAFGRLGWRTRVQSTKEPGFYSGGLCG